MYDIDQEKIDRRAIDIVSKLKEKGHTTYLVGGCVRDLLIGQTPKDFDIATTAYPRQVKKAIRNSFIIGKRFRLVLVKRHDDQFEVATFRRNISEEELLESSEVPFGDNFFGTPKDDAQRRDFKINALFYDPTTNDLIDFCGGLNDISRRVITMLGDPEERLIEDPIRILRALRFKYKTGFSLDPTLRNCMQKHAFSLQTSVLPRIREEFLKILRLPDPSLPFIECFDLGLFEPIAPELHKLLQRSDQANDFYNFLRSFHDTHVNTQDPLEIFSLFTLGLYHCFFSPSQKTGQPPALDELLENKTLSHIMRQELGVFKAEENSILRILNFQKVLENKGIYLRKGQKKKNAILSNEFFSLAYKMSLKDHSLSAEDALFWQQEKQNQKMSASIPSQEINEKTS